MMRVFLFFRRAITLTALTAFQDSADCFVRHGVRLAPCECDGPRRTSTSLRTCVALRSCCATALPADGPAAALGGCDARPSCQARLAILAEMGGNDTLMARRRGAAQRPPTSTCGTNETETGRRWRFRPYLHLWRACSKAVVAFMPPMTLPLDEK
jgi:hypothetical protein